MLHLYAFLIVHLPHRLERARSGADERGQATAEYALILVGVAAIAVALVSWVGRADPIGMLFDFAVGKVLGRFG